VSEDYTPVVGHTDYTPTYTGEFDHVAINRSHPLPAIDPAKVARHDAVAKRIREIEAMMERTSLDPWRWTQFIPDGEMPADVRFVQQAYGDLKYLIHELELRI